MTDNTDERSGDEQPADERSGDEQPADERSGDEQSAGRPDGPSEESVGDPFESLDADEYRDREGDPFESLDGSDPQPADSSGDLFTYPEGSRGSPRERETEPADGADPERGPTDGEYRQSPGGNTQRDAADVDTEGRERQLGDAEAPADLRGDIGSEFDDAGHRGDPFESGASAFDRVSVEEIDPDDVWESLTGAESAGPAPEPEEETVEVSKHAYCETCEHFSEPPDVHCTHEGTRILEFTDMEHVRVANCPVVAERRELGQEESPDESV